MIDHSLNHKSANIWFLILRVTNHNIKFSQLIHVTYRYPTDKSKDFVFVILGNNTTACNSAVSQIRLIPFNNYVQVNTSERAPNCSINSGLLRYLLNASKSFRSSSLKWNLFYHIHQILHISFIIPLVES